jgi:pentatricopeptide repeat protein
MLDFRFMKKHLYRKHKNRHIKNQTKLIEARSATRDKRDVRFADSLEKYVYLKISHPPIPWIWVGIGLIATILGASLAAGYFHSSQLSGDTRSMIEAAARQGDYETARTLYAQMLDSRFKNHVLGVNSDLEELVYPEKKVENEIALREQRIEKYPHSRDLLLGLSTLYAEIGDSRKAAEYREDARILDPNNEMFK